MFLRKIWENLLQHLHKSSQIATLRPYSLSPAAIVHCSYFIVIGQWLMNMYRSIYSFYHQFVPFPAPLSHPDISIQFPPFSPCCYLSQRCSPLVAVFMSVIVVVQHISIQHGGKWCPGTGGERGELDARLPLQFQERKQLIMIRDVPWKGQLKLQQA